jgi:flagellar motor switch protein FliM|tara:strand:+ start:205 stop:1197 length:993 start_codon:yes stop_codon:yes gene_type:complete
MAESENLLSKEELDALTAGLFDGSIEADTGINSEINALRHDLTNEDSSLGVNVGAIDMINERFIRQFRLGLLEVLRTTPKVSMANVQIMKFGEYVRDLAAPLSVNTIRLNPLRGYSMAVIEPSIVFAALDNFFGGFGRGFDKLPPGRLFTPTETSIIKIMLDVLFGSLKEAWAPVLAISCEHISSEINPQFAQIADENDLVVVSRFAAELGRGVSGNIDLVYPYNALKPIRDLLRSRVQTGDGDDLSDKEWSADLRSAAVDAELEVTVELAQIETTLKKFESMSEGDIVYFSKNDHARLYVNSVPVFDADVGANGSQMAARIIRSLDPSK